MSIEDGFSKGFEIDENGKIILFPLKIPDAWKAKSALAEELSVKKKKEATVRKKLPLERLDLKAIRESLLETEVPKKKEINQVVRKKLFDAPPVRYSINRKLTPKRNSLSKNVSRISTGKPPTFGKFGNSSGTAIKNSTYGKFGNTNTAKVTKCQDKLTSERNRIAVAGCTQIKEENEEQDIALNLKNPKLSGDLELNEFIELECAVGVTPKQNKSLTSICKTLQNINLSKCDHEKIIREIEQILTQQNLEQSKLKKKCEMLDEKCKIQEEELKVLKQESLLIKKHFEMQNKEYQSRVEKMNDLIRCLKTNESNKENLNLETVSSSDSKVPLTSIENKGSPRTEKAVDMYNNLRKGLDILSTPGMNQVHSDTPQLSVRRRLSMKVQKQCLLLQDTPR